jgi:hypothetical protein
MFVVQPLTYTIRTKSTFGFPVNTSLYLYDTDHTTQLDYNDNDFANPPFSKITYGFPVTGTYFAKVQHFNPSASGCGPDFWYTLEITKTSLSSSLAEGVAYLPLRLQTMYEPTDVFLPLYWKE